MKIRSRRCGIRWWGKLKIKRIGFVLVVTLIQMVLGTRYNVTLVALGAY